jgi:fructose-1,6-bisphosphatase II / sedoheptulose-1,7-bisphosphatase
MFLGIGGGPEGVLAAAALDTYGCNFQGRFIFDNDNDIHDAKSMGITNLDKKYDLSELVKGDSIFCATGITNSDILDGIKIENKKCRSQTLVTHKNNNLKKIITNITPLNE